jgi:hypothetical protein
MHRILQRLWVGMGLLATAAAAPAAEIVLERSAVDKLLAQTLFTNRGRFDLQRGVCHAYLEKPGVELKGGRIRIRSHLTARLGVESAGSCVGVSFASWTVVSGRPAPQGGTVKLVDLRVDGVDDGAVRMVLESGLFPSLPRAIEFDVLKAVQDMLQSNQAQFQASVDGFQIDSVRAEDDRLAIRFDFKLTAK